MTTDARLALAKDLVIALEQGKESAAVEILSEIANIQESQMFQNVGKLTRQLHDSMAGFSMDSKITTLTENEIPDAKERLQYVISMTEQAANQTLNVVEELLPVSQQLNQQAVNLSEKWDRFLDKEMPFEEFKNMAGEITQYFIQAKAEINNVQSGLNDILMAQGFQDVTGQIIKRVIDLVCDVETSMVELIRMMGGQNGKTAQKKITEPELPGPVVPGIDDKKGEAVTNQDEVDDLLSSLGF